LTPETFEEKPLPGLRISLQPATGGPALESFTNSLGSFTFPALASNTYDIRLDLPANLSPAWSIYFRFISDVQLPPLEIKKPGGEFSVCYIEIHAETSGSISEIIQVPENKFADWPVEADSVDANKEPVDTLLQTDPDTKGAFHISHLPARRYAALFRKNRAFVESVPQIIDLKDGEKKTGLILKAQ
jgi:hypothetical protein